MTSWFKVVKENKEKIKKKVFTGGAMGGFPTTIKFLS